MPCPAHWRWLQGKDKGGELLKMEMFEYVAVLTSIIVGLDNHSPRAVNLRPNETGC